MFLKDKSHNNTSILSAYIKPTNFCSIECKHCYLKPEIRTDRSIMSYDTLENTVNMIYEMLQNGSYKRVHIIWHGGEPMSISADWFHKAGECLDILLPKAIRTESMQSSMMLMREEYVGLARERFNSYIGSSVDFSLRSLHGSGNQYLSNWLKKVDYARSNGISVVPSMVPTVNEIGHEEGIVKWFEDHDFWRFNIERYNNYMNHSESLGYPSNAQHSKFMCGLFDALMNSMKKHGKAPVVRSITSAIKGILYFQPGDRWGTRCMSNSIVVNPDGSLNNCPDKANVETSFSNVSDGYQEYLNSPARRKWIRVSEMEHQTEKCVGCKYISWCGSGCPITCEDQSAECTGYYTYLSHVESYCEQNLDLIKEYLNLFKKGRSVTCRKRSKNSLSHQLC